MCKTVTFMNACNKRFQQALTPANRLTLDESMIKDFHKDLPAEIKIPRKPRPVGNEIKDLCDAVTKIVLVMELNEGKDCMVKKPFTKEFGATAVGLTQPYWGSENIVYAD